MEDQVLMLVASALTLSAVYVVAMIGFYEAIDDDLKADAMVKAFWNYKIL